MEGWRRVLSNLTRRLFMQTSSSYSSFSSSFSSYLSLPRVRTHVSRGGPDTVRKRVFWYFDLFDESSYVFCYVLCYVFVSFSVSLEIWYRGYFSLHIVKRVSQCSCHWLSSGVFFRSSCSIRPSLSFEQRGISICWRPCVQSLLSF